MYRSLNLRCLVVTRFISKLNGFCCRPKTRICCFTFSFPDSVYSYGILVAECQASPCKNVIGTSESHVNQNMKFLMVIRWLGASKILADITDDLVRGYPMTIFISARISARTSTTARGEA